MSSALPVTAKREEPHVVYLADDGSLWIRPVSMFCEEVDRDGYRGPRFALVEEKNSPLGDI